MSDKTYKYLDLDGLGTFYDNLKNQLTPFIEITYETLKSKRDNNELIPGSFYRIIDYITTTTQENTQSAGHQFDIIVTAISENKLSETAFAIIHEGDTYFTDSNLSAWELKYSLDNDTTRFSWADTENGKGVIYYMKDEWNNECPYDFKNIMFYLNEVNAYVYTLYAYVNYDNTSQNVIDMSSHKYNGVADGEAYEIPVFNNITINTSDNSIYQNFIGMNIDNTVNLPVGCYNIYIDSGSINNMIFESYDIKIDKNCTDNYISRCNNIKINKLCKNNNIGYELDDLHWTDNIIIGDNCENNRLNDCNNIIIGDDCTNNDIDASSDNIIIGNNCTKIYISESKKINIGNNCTNISISYNVTYLNIGNNCNYIYQSDDAYNNVIGNNCNNITFGELCNNNIVENNCSYITLTAGVNEDGDNIDATKYRFTNGLNGDSSNVISIVGITNNHEMKVARNSAGEIKVYCEADLIA